jgi:hypothetical protein
MEGHSGTRPSTKALVYQGPGSRAWEDVPDATVADSTDLVMRVDAATICSISSRRDWIEDDGRASHTVARACLLLRMRGTDAGGILDTSRRFGTHDRCPCV